MFEFFVAVCLVLMVGGLAMVGLICGVVWFGWRRLRRYPLVAAGRVAVQGALALNAHRVQLPANRKAALRSLRVGHQQRRLRQRVQVAERSGAYLGEVTGLLPRLEAESRRIRSGLASPTARREALTRADRHLQTLADLSAAVDGATITASSDGSLHNDARDAALGVHLRNEAYAELISATSPARDSARPLSNAAH